MKVLFSLLVLFGTTVLYSQKAAKIINSCDVGKMRTHFEKGGDINERIRDWDEGGEEYSYNLLSYAVGEECKEIVEYFIEIKDDFEDFDLVLSEAFTFSLSVGNDEISSRLYDLEPLPKGVCDACHGNNSLMVAATYGREDWFYKLQPTSDITYINNGGATLVHAAASGPSQKILETVLHFKELDVNQKDTEGLTALDYAASNEENPLAFNALINHGADHNEAWNLLYWWTMYQVPLTPEMIIDRREDVWMIDEDGDNCLMLLSYFYDGDAGVEGAFQHKMVTIINFMLEDYKDGKGNYDYVEDLYSSGVTNNYLDAMLYLEDFNVDQPIYPKYLELIGLICDKNEFCPVYKKEFKRAAQIYGEAVAEAWYTENNLPTK